jgi:hypothetical protein
MMGWATDFEGKHCWFVDVAVGNLSKLILQMPFVLPYVAFYRRKEGKLSKLKIVKTERLLNLC